MGGAHTSIPPSAKKVLDKTTHPCYYGSDNTDRRLTHMILLEWWVKEWKEKSTFEKILSVIGSIWFIAYCIVLPTIAAIGLAQLLW